MSYNVTRSFYLSGGLQIRQVDLLRLGAKFKDHTPSNCFLNDVDLHEGPANQLLHIDWRFSSDWSGIFYNEHLAEVLSKTIGEAEILFVWESGDHFSGLHVKDGVMMPKDVEFKLIALRQRASSSS